MKNVIKKYSAYGVRTKQLTYFINFYKISKGLYAITITLHIAQLCLPLS